MKTDLERGFDDLLKHDGQRRGFEFQKWLYELFLEARFEVNPNPLLARPRQTDIHVRRDDLDFLIEAKWQRSPIDVADIDSLRIRLDRTASDVVGCFFSLADYRKTAIEAVENNRTREILLFDAAEIRDLAHSPEMLWELVEDKRRSLRIGGRVRFHKEKAKRRKSVTRLPASHVRLWRDGRAINCVASVGDFRSIGFTQRHLDGIGSSDDSEFSLRLDLNVRQMSELREFMGILHNHLGLSGSGTFSIHQTNTSWHGTGAEDFLSAGTEWANRYSEASLSSWHHSETLFYVDEFQNGQLVLAVQQRVGDSTFLHGGEAELRFPGIPLDNQPLVEVCRKTDNRRAYLSIVREKHFDQIALRNEKVTLEAVGEIHSLEDGEKVTVCGIIAKNPFFRKPKALAKSNVLAKWPIDQLCDVEIMCCALKDWHDVDDVAERYYLTGIQTKWIGSTLVVRPDCTWTRLKERDDDRLASSNKKSRAARTKPKMRSKR